jgi:phospholipase C
MNGGSENGNGGTDRSAGFGAKRVSRRTLLGGGATVAAAGVLGPALLGRAFAQGAETLGSGGTSVSPGATEYDALQALGRTTLRKPGSRPFPGLPEGTDTMPQIENVVMLMMENHSFDNFFGMLGRGDGFTLGSGGLPTASNPYPDGSVQHAFHMPTTCQLSGSPSQEWTASHTAYDNGLMDGFVRAQPSAGSSAGVAMGYWNGADLPFTYSLASVFPIADRWFCSLLGQTDPNRRYLIAGTSAGMTDDVGDSVGQDLQLLSTARGTIFDRLHSQGISFTDYNEGFPTGTTAELYPVDDTLLMTGSQKKPMSSFFTDCAAGNLPAFTFLDPNYGTQSQENPQNIVVGEAFLASVVNAIGAGPGWSKTVLIITYDEHGGYYDHVPPPPALAPDNIGPDVQPGESKYEGFRRYGVRVPGLIVSPYAQTGYVSHTVFDHTSVLAFLERKWNLPAMTMRDANANDLTDLLDLTALAAGTPTFPELPALAAPGDTPAALACSTSGPGTVPPAGSVTPAATTSSARRR